MNLIKLSEDSKENKELIEDIIYSLLQGKSVYYLNNDSEIINEFIEENISINTNEYSNNAYELLIQNFDDFYNYFKLMGFVLIKEKHFITNDIHFQDFFF